MFPVSFAVSRGIQGMDGISGICLKRSGTGTVAPEQHTPLPPTIDREVITGTGIAD